MNLIFAAFLDFCNPLKFNKLANPLLFFAYSPISPLSALLREGFGRRPQRRQRLFDGLSARSLHAGPVARLQ